MFDVQYSWKTAGLAEKTGLKIEYSYLNDFNHSLIIFLGWNGHEESRDGPYFTCLTNCKSQTWWMSQSAKRIGQKQTSGLW